MREDLRRENCALIVLDPKGDAAEAVLSIVPRSRTATLLDMASPTAGFNPLAVDAAPDAIADQVVAALRGLFSEGEVRGSSDRYLRNAVIAVLACEPSATLWDVARLLEVSDAGRIARARVAHRLVELPSHAELATFFAHELPAQLADARATTTAKLDAPANKLARLLNSPAVKRVLLNDSLRIDLDGLIERGEVLIVRGALGEIGAGNVAVLMQLLLGMLDAALSRVQDRRTAGERRAVALKIDEAPLAINAAFAQTLALKRSAGLETVACWQTDAQWEPELREQLDALFAHRVLFATASALDARSGSALLMSEFSDQIRAGDQQLAKLASPDVRLHLPRHTALASWTTAAGRERPFIATTMPLSVDRARIDWHVREQHARGGRELPEPAPPVDLFATQPADRTSVVGSQSPHGEALQLPRKALQSPRTVPQSPHAQALQLPRLGDRRLASRTTRELPRGPQSPPATSPQSPPATSPQSPPAAPPPRGSAPASHAELLALDAAGRMRVLSVPAPVPGRRLAVGDRDLLEWLAAARCALTSQIHRRVNPERSLTVTQRQLKRLADRGLIARFQLHRDDGGGTPLCCAVTERAIELLGTEGRRAPELRDEDLGELRRDIHTVGWLLALEARVGDALVEVLGPGRAAIVPGTSAPAGLASHASLHPRDFLVSGPDGSRRPVEHFVPVRPSAVASLRVIVEGSERRRDLLVVPDTGNVLAELEAYDHLLGGWWISVERYRRAGAPPAVVVICSDEAQALAHATVADSALTATLAEIGVPPALWRRPGRDGIRFVDEAELHDGALTAWTVPSVPPSLRGSDEERPSPVALLQLPPGCRAGSAKPPWR